MEFKGQKARVRQEAFARWLTGKDNPLFTGTTSLYWDGVVIREIPEIGSFNNTAGVPIPVAPIYLCGAQALAVAWAQMRLPSMSWCGSRSMRRRSL